MWFESNNSWIQLHKILKVLLDPLKIFQNLFVQMLRTAFTANQNFPIHFLWGSLRNVCCITTLSWTCIECFWGFSSTHTYYISLIFFFVMSLDWQDRVWWIGCTWVAFAGVQQYQFCLKFCSNVYVMPCRRQWNEIHRISVEFHNLGTADFPDSISDLMTS